MDGTYFDRGSRAVGVSGGCRSALDPPPPPPSLSPSWAASSARMGSIVAVTKAPYSMAGARIQFFLAAQVVVWAVVQVGGRAQEALPSEACRQACTHNTTAVQC